MYTITHLKDGANKPPIPQPVPRPGSAAPAAEPAAAKASAYEGLENVPAIAPADIGAWLSA